jgi:hypothetical protein
MRGRSVDIRVSIREERRGHWSARAALQGREDVTASAATRQRCLAAIRRSLHRALDRPGEGREIVLVVEIEPVLAGVAEAAEVMGWDKRRVVTYIDRGRFPEPLQSLASGRIWLRSDIEAFAEQWRGRQRMRRPPGSARAASRSRGEGAHAG